jgi:uncharacterized membrane protein
VSLIKQHLDIALVLLFSSILILLILVFPIDVSRIIVGLPFVVFFPGYTLISALFPRKTEISGIERVTLSVVMSIAVVPLLGLMLNFTPWGIRLYPILISSATFIVIMSVIAILRRSGLAANERFTFTLDLSFIKRLYAGDNSEPSIAPGHIPPPTKPPSPYKTGWLKKALSIILVIAIIVSIITLYFFVSTPKAGDKYTEFYILGMDDTANNYPKQIKLGESAQVLASIVNHEQEVTYYRLIVNTDNITCVEIPSIVLNKEQKWEQKIAFMPSRIGSNQKVAFVLYRGESDTPYLTLHLWIDVLNQ